MVLDLQEDVFGHRVEVLQVPAAGVRGRHTQHLVVAAHLIGHAEHRHRVALDQAAGKGGFGADH